MEAQQQIRPGDRVVYLNDPHGPLYTVVRAGETFVMITDNIRTYSVEGTLADIPRLAEEFGLRVSLGIWISPDIERNEREIAKAIELANSSRSVVR